MTPRFVTASLIAAAISVASIEVAAAQEAPESHEFNVPFDRQPMLNPCTGETVLVDGNLDFLFNVTADNRGGTHLKIHASSKGTGVGLTTATQYVFSDVSDSEDYQFEAQVVSTFTHSTVFISAASTNNFVMHTTVHITVAQGIPTAEVKEIKTDCRG